MKQDVEMHLLDCLVEEAAELIMAVEKVKRFGHVNDHDSQDFENTHQVSVEYNHVLAVASMLNADFVVWQNLEPNEAIQREKIDRLERHMELSRKDGRLAWH